MPIELLSERGIPRAGSLDHSTHALLSILEKPRSREKKIYHLSEMWQKIRENKFLRRQQKHHGVLLHRRADQIFVSVVIAAKDCLNCPTLKTSSYKNSGAFS